MTPYPSKTWLSPKVEIRSSPVAGQGMFAKVPIKAGEKVVMWGGTYTDHSGVRKARSENKLVMQWDDNLYSVEERGDDEGYFINHSCDPNMWMQDAFTLVARRDVKQGDKLTADYALWEADENYVSKWECHCNSPHCRKRITGKDWRLKELQETYRGHFSPLINKRIESLQESV